MTNCIAITRYHGHGRCSIVSDIGPLFPVCIHIASRHAEQVFVLTPAQPMDILLHSSWGEYLPHICVAISTVLALYLTYLCGWRGRSQLKPNYAFSASTKVRRRPPTVLQFSARVPLGVPTTPSVLRTFDEDPLLENPDM